MLPTQREHPSLPAAAPQPVAERAIERFGQRRSPCPAGWRWSPPSLASPRRFVRDCLLFLLPQVGSRTVIVAGACAMLLGGIFGKVGAMLASIPGPVIGGMFLVMFGVITAVGISNLQVTAVRAPLHPQGRGLWFPVRFAPG